MEKPFNDYNIGTDFLRDTNYLKRNLKRAIPDDERQFCREMFAAMYEATSAKINPSNLVYPYTFETASSRSEVSYYHASRQRNSECARRIDALVKDSLYDTHCYNLEGAAFIALLEYGFNRVCQVLTFNIHSRKTDGRFSPANRKWFDCVVPKCAFGDSCLETHVTLIDGFADYVRKLYESIDAARLDLPGQEEHGATNAGFNIIRSIMVDENQGYVIAHNPNASCSQWVCWQFYIRDVGRNYNWGIYGDDEQTAIDGFNARVFAALYEGDNS
jgi:hypothetical protein